MILRAIGDTSINRLISPRVRALPHDGAADHTDILADIVRQSPGVDHDCGVFRS